jgi:hypothetical protein
MTSIGPGDYVVVVPPTIGGTKAQSIKLAIQREPRSGESLFLVGNVLPNEEHVDLPFLSCFKKPALL